MNEQQQRTLIEGLHALAATTKHVSAPQHVEAAVLAEMARAHGHAGEVTKTSRSAGGAWLALAATLLLACGSGIWLVQRTPSTQLEAMQTGGFLDIPAAAYLPPMESGSIVRTELPLSALPSYGISIVPEMTTDLVDVDLLVAQDGLARGIRLVNNSQTRSTP